ncbi:MAG: hypothetical protein V2A73_20800 [Pseudomonadota bacterium]
MAVLFVLIAGLAGVLLWSRMPPAESAAPVTREPRPEKPKVVERDLKLEHLEEMLKAAQQHLKDNPGDLDGAIEKFRVVYTEAAGTRVQLAALDEMKRVEGLCAVEVERIQNDLRQKADALATEGDYEKARSVLSDYAGPFASATAAWRSSEVERLTAQQDQIAKDYLRRLDPVLVQLITPKFDGIRETVTAFQAEPAYKEAPAATRELMTEILAVTALPERVMTRLSQLKGKTLTLGLSTGAVSLEIVGLKDNGTVDAFSQTQYGKVKRTVEFRDLTPKESHRLLGDDKDGTTRIMRGLLLLAAKQADAAKKEFAQAGTGLAGLLIERLEGRPHVEPVKAVKEAAPLTDKQVEEINSRLDAAIRKLENLNGLLTIKSRKVDKGGVTLDLTGNANLKFLEPLEGIPIQSLNLKNTAVLDITALRRMPMRALDLSGTKIQDLAPLRGMRLESLDLSGTAVADLVPLRGMPLQSLNISGTKVSSLSPLKGISLTELKADSTGVDDLDPLKGMPLKKLSLAYTRVTSLVPLEGMPLENIHLEFSKITDLSPLKGMPLLFLGINYTGIVDLRPLAGMCLKEFVAPGVPVSDIRVLKGMPLVTFKMNTTKVDDLQVLKGMPLVSVWAGGAELKGDKVASALASLELCELRIETTVLKDITFLKDMPVEFLDIGPAELDNLDVLVGKRIQYFWARGARIRDYNTLQTLPLVYLGLSGSTIADISLLRGRTLWCLDLSNTCIRDIRPLENMPLEMLFLHGCKNLDDISTLATLKKLTALTVPEHLPLRKLDFLRGLPALRKLGYSDVLNVWPPTTDLTVEQFFEKNWAQAQEKDQDKGKRERPRR